MQILSAMASMRQASSILHDPPYIVALISLIRSSFDVCPESNFFPSLILSVKSLMTFGLLTDNVVT